jgi:hypothetical protein
MATDHPIIEKLLKLPPEQLIDANKLIELGIAKSLATIHYLRTFGAGPRFRTGPRKRGQSRYLYSPADVISWLRSSVHGQKALANASRAKNQSTKVTNVLVADMLKGWPSAVSQAGGHTSK